MNFKDLQYSIGRLTTDVRGQIARNNPLQKQDTKALSMWIFNERNNLATMRTLAYQQSETNKVFQQWTKEELLNDKGENGRDIEDIGDKLFKLLEKLTEIEQQYAAKHQQYRHAIKSIRDREDRLSDIREKKRTLSSRISNLTTSSPKSPKLRELQKELTSLDRDTHDTELEMGDFKRFALKEAFYLRFNAMNEYAEKTAMVAGFGKYIVDLLDIAPTPVSEPSRRPYEMGTEAAMIFADAMNALDAWQPREGDERPTIASNTSKYQGTTTTDGGNNTSVDDGEKEDHGKGKGKERMESTATASATATATETETTASATETTASATETETETTTETITIVKPDDTQEEQQEHDEITSSGTTQVQDPPRLPPRSPVPSTATATATTTSTTTPAVPSGYSTNAIALVTSDHKSPQDEETRQDLDELDLYDAPPPAYEDTRQPIDNTSSSSPRNSYEPTATSTTATTTTTTTTTSTVVQDQDAKTPIPDIQEPPTPSLPPAPSTAHARPISHEDKEQIDEEHEFQSPYQSHQTIVPSTPSTIYYQQSPQPMHQYQQSPQPMHHHQQSTMMSTLRHDSSVSSMSWHVPGAYGGVEPNYHHGQYQQLYDQLTQRQQHGPIQRPYAEFQQQYMRQYQDVGGFRIPTTTHSSQASSSTTHLSADEEKRQLAERFAREETQARQASIQTLHQEKKPLPPVTAHKKSVITPEGEDHGYKSNKRV